MDLIVIGSKMFVISILLSEKIGFEPTIESSIPVSNRVGLANSSAFPCEYRITVIAVC